MRVGVPTNIALKRLKIRELNRCEQSFAVWAARSAAQTAKLSQRRTSKKQKVLQRSTPFVSETFVSYGLLAGAPALETDVKGGFGSIHHGSAKPNSL
jgi:hypothetical protein